MKKLLIATLFIPFGLYAQEGFQEEIINQEALTPAFRYENLDTTEITSGNLINRSLVLSNHAVFYKDSTGINNYSGWQQLFNTVIARNEARMTKQSVLRLNRLLQLQPSIPTI